MILARLIYLLIRPDFMQEMLLIGLFFLLPLKKRPHWQRRAVVVILSGLLVGVGLTYLVSLFGWTNVLTLLYYPTPLLAAFALLYFCHDGSWKESLYGTGCAYAAQHIAFSASIILWGEQWISYAVSLRLLENWGLDLAVFLLVYCLVAKRLPEEGHYPVTLHKALMTAGIVLFVALFLNRIIRNVWYCADATAYSICMTYDLVCCLLILVLQLGQHRESMLLAEIQTERHLRRQMKAQYELSKESIDMINRKSHDLKHQISALRLVKDPQKREDGLREIERSTLIYDTLVQTGNEVLDTVLTEKGLLCQKNQISWTCMADGSVLNFISPVDLYTLLGNALDNAIESSKLIENPDLRVVRTRIQPAHGAAFIQIENYYAHSIRMERDIPQTTKKDPADHGYGLQSIRSITEHYGGTFDIEYGNGCFLLSILIPFPSLAAK